MTNDLNVKSINLIEDNIRFKVISQECITSIKFVIRHFRISIVAMSKFVEQIGNTWIGRGTKRRKNRKGRRSRRIWFTAVNIPTEIAIPTAFPTLWFASMGRSCYSLFAASTVASPSLWMSETTTFAIYTINLYNTVSKLRVKYRVRIKTFLFNLILSIAEKKSFELFTIYEREKVIEKKLFSW